MTSTRQLALRFISGKFQGSEYALSDSGEMLVGRSGDVQIVLSEDMVSRRHARIQYDGQRIQIEDLGSTNGTFVNGEKIKRADLKEGDRVLIGSSIFKVVYADSAVSAPRRRADDASMGRTQARTMTGAIEEIPLPDVLQLLGSSKKTGVLVIQSTQGIGRLRMRKGIIVHVAIDTLEGVPPLKCAYRMLAWTHGTFELEPADENPVPGEIELAVHELLMEGLRQMDEYNHLRANLPELTARLLLAYPLLPPLRDLTPAELDVFQLAYNEAGSPSGAVLGTMLDKSAASDLDTSRAVLRLVSGGYLKTS
jgi:hypothetical protein